MDSYVILIIIAVILLILFSIYLVIKKSLNDNDKKYTFDKVEKLSPYNQADVYRLNNLNDNARVVRKSKPITPPNFDRNKPIGYKNKSYGEQTNMINIFKK